MRSYNVELVTEFAKDKIWDDQLNAMNNQAYIFGEQYQRLFRLEKKVDIVITDSPLPFSIIFNNNSALRKNFEKAVLDVYNSYNNIDFFIHNITKNFTQTGRRENKEESLIVEQKMKKLLKENKIIFESYGNNELNYELIVKETLAILDVCKIYPTNLKPVMVLI